MLSRIFWIGLAGIALVAGMILQDGRGMISWDDSADHKRSVETRVDTAIDRSFARMQVVGSDGEVIVVPAETKRALAAAVAELVRAEADLAVSKIGDENDEAVRAAQARRDRANAKVDRLKAEIERLEKAPARDSDAISAEVRQQIRDEVRAEIRDAVRN